MLLGVIDHYIKMGLK